MLHMQNYAIQFYLQMNTQKQNKERANIN